jgi:multidrug efflux system membrane fusion protein
MIVSLRVATKGATAPQPVVPLNAVIKSRSNANGYAVMVMTDEGGRQLARFRDVKLGDSFGNTVAVTEGLKPGDRVIVTGGTMVNDGDWVKVIP